MGFLFLKKSKKGRDKPDVGEDQLPPLPTDDDLYAELPTLPETPEGSELPEIDLPKPLKEKQPAEPQPELITEPVADIPEEPLKLPEWPEIPVKMAEHKPEIIPRKIPFFSMTESARPKAPEPAPLPKAPKLLPEITHFKPKTPRGEASVSAGLTVQNDGFYIGAPDFMAINNNLKQIMKLQRRHHKLNEIDKEETQRYEQFNKSLEDIQRKLLQVDRTIFDQN